MTTLLVVVGGLLAGLLLFLTSQSESRQEIGAIAQYGECDAPGPPNEPGLPPCPGPPECPPGNPPNDPDCPPGPPNNCPPQSQNPNCPDQDVGPESGGGAALAPPGAEDEGTLASSDPICVELTPDSQDESGRKVVPAPLLGENVVPGPGDPDGNGELVLCVRADSPDDSGSICFGVAYEGIGDPTRVFLGRGKKGKEGSAVSLLFNAETDDGTEKPVLHGCSDETDDAFEAEFQPIRSEFADPEVDTTNFEDEPGAHGQDVPPVEAFDAPPPELLEKIVEHPRRYFVQVDNEEFPKGALRGQLRPFSERPEDSEAGIF